MSNDEQAQIVSMGCDAGKPFSPAGGLVSGGVKMRTADDIVTEAWARFDRWCRENDPDGDMDPVERVHAYAEWCDFQKRKAELQSSL